MGILDTIKGTFIKSDEEIAREKAKKEALLATPERRSRLSEYQRKDMITKEEQAIWDEENKKKQPTQEKKPGLVERLITYRKTHPPRQRVQRVYERQRYPPKQPSQGMGFGGFDYTAGGGVGGFNVHEYAMGKPRKTTQRREKPFNVHEYAMGGMTGMWNAPKKKRKRGDLFVW